jgi:DUF2892 family protein
MTTNLGSMDRMMRLSIASAMFWVVALGLAKGLWAFIPMSIATMLVVTWHSGHCPVYRFFGWSTYTPTKHRA